MILLDAARSGIFYMVIAPHARAFSRGRHFGLVFGTIPVPVRLTDASGVGARGPRTNRMWNALLAAAGVNVTSSRQRSFGSSSAGQLPVTAKCCVTEVKNGSTTTPGLARGLITVR